MFKETRTGYYSLFVSRFGFIIVSSNLVPSLHLRNFQTVHYCTDFLSFTTIYKKNTFMTRLDEKEHVGIVVGEGNDLIKMSLPTLISNQKYDL